MRVAAKSSLPGKRILLAVGGFAAATAVSLGLAAAVSNTIADPSTLPEPAPALLASAQQDPSSTAYVAASGPSIHESAYEPIVTMEVPATVVAIAEVVVPTAEPVAPVASVAPVLSAPETISTPIAEPVAVQPQVMKPQPIFVPGAASEPVSAPPTVAPTEAPVVSPPAPAGPGFYLPESVASDSALESALLGEINARRAEAGLAAYVSDSSLVRIARTRSQQMVDKGYFSHVDPESGQYMYTALLAYFGVRYAWAGENLALNNYNRAESPGAAIVRLMNSATHRANILAGDFSRIGVGVVVHPDGRIFYTMIFVG